MILVRQYGQFPVVCTHGSKQAGWNLCAQRSRINPSPSRNLSRHIQHSSDSLVTPSLSPEFLKTSRCRLQRAFQSNPGVFFWPASWKGSAPSVCSARSAYGTAYSNHCQWVSASQSPGSLTVKSASSSQAMPEAVGDCLLPSREPLSLSRSLARARNTAPGSWSFLISPNVLTSGPAAVPLLPLSAPDSLVMRSN